jgi:hypothetical protein
VRGDITDTGSLREAAREADAVVRAALMHGGGRGGGAYRGRGRARRLAGDGADVRIQQRGVVVGDTAEGVDLADEETRVDPPPMFAW